MNRAENTVRRKGYRPPSKKVLIVGDGKSEEVYFRSFTGLNPHIRVISKGTGKVGINEALKKAKGFVKSLSLDPSAGDRVVIVMDLDLRYKLCDVNDMDARCEKSGYELYLSNPCFEVWLVNHFCRLTRPSTPEELEKKLCETMQSVTGRAYTKSGGISWTEDMLQGAISNSSLVKDDLCNHKWCLENNPSTLVHLLVTSILEKPH